MQHMGVIKDFSIPYTVTNNLTVPAPVLTMTASDVVRWTGMSDVTYTVQSKTNFAGGWMTNAAVTSATTNFAFTNANPGAGQRFYRVTYP
jgi:hypothetical protein